MNKQAVKNTTVPKVVAKKPQSLVETSVVSTEETPNHEACPSCPAQPEISCPTSNNQQKDSNLEQLLKKGNEFKISLTDDGQSLF